MDEIAPTLEDMIRKLELEVRKTEDDLADKRMRLLVLKLQRASDND